MDHALAKALWLGHVVESGDLDRRLVDLLTDQSDYSACLKTLTRYSSHGIITPLAMQKALILWPWSIDMAVLALETSANPRDALDHLHRTVLTQNRRYSCVAWAAWRRGETALARDTVAKLDPSSVTFHADRVARAELAILSGDTAERIPGPEGVRLSLLQTWRIDGAQALRRRVDLEKASLPAMTALWSWLIDVCIVERNFGMAAQMMQAYELRCGAEHPEGIALKIRLLLEQGDYQRARNLLSHSTDPATPWEWTPRQLAQHIRCLLQEASAQTNPDHLNVLHFAVAAHRLYPLNPTLRSLYYNARELLQDWDTLADQHGADAPDPMVSATALARLGLPEAAVQTLRLARLPQTPDGMHWGRLRMGEFHLRCGDLAQAEAALGPVPAQWPHQADHAYWASEIALARRDIAAARHVLAPALARGPTRMGLLLNASRAAFLDGEYAESLEYLARFRTLKTAQTGIEPSPDLRDLIVEDAQTAIEKGLADSQSPGLAARSLALVPPVFSPTPDAPPIPQTLAHYWEGKRSAPVERGVRQWATQHPGFAQTVFDAPEAARWLQVNAPDLSALFDRLAQPALRADLFRVAYMAVAGGLFADLDEYPRAPVTPWLKDARAVLVIEVGHGTVANNFLAARPGLALFRRLHARISARLRQTSSPYAWWDSGPAQLTLEAYAASRDPMEAPGMRFLSQADYDARVSTNLPFPHKHGIGHWRT